MFAIRILFLLIVLSAAAFTCRAQEKCINYEPEVVNLVGNIARRTFINANDQKEVMWVLKLATPVCANATEGDDFNVRRSRVTDVQLVLDPEMYSTYRQLVGKRVKATGSLFGEQTAHHFTPVLLAVKEIEPSK